MATAMNSVSEWINYLSKHPIPVLKQTARELLLLKEDENKLSVRTITPIVLNDPLMVFRVISYAKKHQGRHQLQDLIQVEQAILMMGTNAFYQNLHPSPLIEDQLKTNIPAMMHLLKLIKRAHRATYFATDWAAFHKDLHSDEVHIATLLHDLAEMLMWCLSLIHIFHSLPVKNSTRETVLKKPKDSYKRIATMAKVVNTAESAASIKISSITRSLMFLRRFLAKRGLIVRPEVLLSIVVTVFI